MKKLALFVLVIITLISCEKEPMYTYVCTGIDNYNLCFPFSTDYDYSLDYFKYTYYDSLSERSKEIHLNTSTVDFDSTYLQFTSPSEYKIKISNYLVGTFYKRDTVKILDQGTFTYTESDTFSVCHPQYFNNLSYTFTSSVENFQYSHTAKRNCNEIRLQYVRILENGDSLSAHIFLDQ